MIFFCHIAMKRREAKTKGVKERYTYLNAEFQRIARRDKKVFLNYQCKEIEENNRTGRTRDLFWRRQWHPLSSTLAWKIPWTEELDRLQSMGSLRVGHDWATSFSYMGEGNGNPLQCSCLENPRGTGDPLRGRTESDMTEVTVAAAAAADISSRKLEILREHFMQRWAK